MTTMRVLFGFHSLLAASLSSSSRAACPPPDTLADSSFARHSRSLQSNPNAITETTLQNENKNPRNDGREVGGVPVIDLSRSDDDPEMIREIAEACRSPGFFQVTNHGISETLLNKFRQQCHLFYQLPTNVKHSLKRHASNARGYFDDELTKQRRDWKEALDVGVPGSRCWDIPDNDARNACCLDGVNQFPPQNMLPDYRRVTVAYFEACEALSQRLAVLMARGLLAESDGDGDAFLQDLASNHSSYLRTNYYPPYPMDENSSNDDLGISPHKDAGFLTVLLQDDDCHSLQVLRQPCREQEDDSWITVQPIPGALTINTGDMAQVWSNGRYQAPLHRVLTHSHKPRYSAPFFYNPPYHCTVAPRCLQPQLPLYHPVLWAYFRALRFAGDVTDLGELEIQIEDFETTPTTSSSTVHLKRQQAFLDRGMAHQRFNVEKFRELLNEEEGSK